jgi:hypothetical protein
MVPPGPVPQGCARAHEADRNRRHTGTLSTRPPQDTAVPNPVSSHRRRLPVLEAAIITAEQVLTERLAHLAWCGSVGRSTTVAETLVRATELRLEGLWQERDWQLGHENDGLERPS